MKISYCRNTLVDSGHVGNPQTRRRHTGVLVYIYASLPPATMVRSLGVSQPQRLGGPLVLMTCNCHASVTGPHAVSRSRSHKSSISKVCRLIHVTCRFAATSTIQVHRSLRIHLKILYNDSTQPDMRECVLRENNPSVQLGVSRTAITL